MTDKWEAFFQIYALLIYVQLQMMYKNNLFDVIVKARWYVIYSNNYKTEAIVHPTPQPLPIFGVMECYFRSQICNMILLYIFLTCSPSPCFLGEDTGKDQRCQLENLYIYLDKLRPSTATQPQFSEKDENFVVDNTLCSFCASSRYVEQTGEPWCSYLPLSFSPES